MSVRVWWVVGVGVWVMWCVWVGWVGVWNYSVARNVSFLFLCGFDGGPLKAPPLETLLINKLFVFYFYSLS